MLPLSPALCGGGGQEAIALWFAQVSKQAMVWLALQQLFVGRHLSLGKYMGIWANFAFL